MKNQKLNLIALGVAIAMLVLAFACSPKKTEEAKEETNSKMEMADTKAVEQTVTEVKVFENVDACVKTQINGLLSNYFELTNALTEDNADDAKVAAKTFKDDLAKFDMSKLMGEQMDFYHTQEANLSQALKGIIESVDIEELRTELATVSDSMHALTKAYHANSTTVYYNFCPMAKNNDGAYWLSKVKVIKNPYMGQIMPHCGSTKETID